MRSDQPIHSGCSPGKEATRRPVIASGMARALRVYGWFSIQVLRVVV